MGNSSYQSGARFERRVKKALEKLGYFCMRSPASKSPVDIIALGTKAKLLIQCKVSGVLAPRGWNELVDTCERSGMAGIVALRHKRAIVWMLVVGRKISGGKQPWVKVSMLENRWKEFVGNGALIRLDKAITDTAAGALGVLHAPMDESTKKKSAYRSRPTT
jgi:Holliday junction resolvase